MMSKHGIQARQGCKIREIERTKCGQIYELKIWWVGKVSQGLRGSELKRQECGG